MAKEGLDKLQEAQATLPNMRMLLLPKRRWVDNEPIATHAFLNQYAVPIIHRRLHKTCAQIFVRDLQEPTCAPWSETKRPEAQ